MINYWLIKSEPSNWSWENQVKERVTMWDGVRNYQARNNLTRMSNWRPKSSRNKYTDHGNVSLVVNSDESQRISFEFTN